MSVQINKVHIGSAIEARRRELDMTKTELARRISIPQQHVNKMTAKENIDTARLIQVSEALDFNFFSLYGEVQSQGNTHIEANACFGSKAEAKLFQDSSSRIELEREKEKNKGLREKNQSLQDQILTLQDQIAEFKKQLERLDKAMDNKDEIIELLKERRQ